MPRFIRLQGRPRIRGPGLKRRLVRRMLGRPERREEPRVCGPDGQRCPCRRDVRASVAATPAEVAACELNCVFMPEGRFSVAILD